MRCDFNLSGPRKRGISVKLAQAQVGATLTALQYRDALKRLGLTFEDAAKLQGISDVKSRKRALGMVTIPPEAAALLWLMLAMRIDPKDAMSGIASMESPPP